MDLKKLSTVIIDDEQHAIDVLSNYVNSSSDLTLVFTETNPLQSIKRLSKIKPPDIVFCDIEMPGMSGTDLADVISVNSQLVFATGYDQYILEGYEKNAVDYLLKPITEERFRSCIDRCWRRWQGKVATPKYDEEEDSFYIRIIGVEGRKVRILKKDILYVESMCNHLIFYEINKDPIKAYLTFAEVSDVLPSTKYVRIHRSYLVNIDQIASFNGSSITFAGTDIQLPVSNFYKNNFRQIMDTKVIKSCR